MPPDNEKQPLTAPVLTHARMQWDTLHPNGFIHLTKKDPGGHDIITIGYVRGSDLQRGWTVNIQKNNKKKTWEGTIYSGPATNGAGQLYWTFQVVNKVDLPDPVFDETLTVTVTDTNGQTSPPVPADPQPAVIP